MILFQVGIFVGVVNVVNGYGLIVGVVIIVYLEVDKIVFIGFIEVGCNFKFIIKFFYCWLKYKFQYFLCMFGVKI